jgi:predicted phosphodiesterase
MAGTQSTQGKVVVEYVRRYPKLPKQTIAKLIMQEQPGLFPSLEAARKRVRDYCGVGSSTMNPDKHGTRRAKGVSGADAWADLMPESWAEPIEPFVVPASVRKLLVLSDIHVPFHDIGALTAAIKWGMTAKPDAVLLNGDTLDFYAISDHEKDPRKVRWSEELEASRQVLRMVRQAFPAIPIYFKEGNHEYRMERHLMKHAPVLIGMQEFELPVLLRMGEAGIEYIRNKRMVYAGELTIGHGDEWKGSGGVNPGRWAGLRAKESVLVGHFHRASEHIERTVRGNVRGYWSLGCLCELQPAYLPYNEWAHGFALVHLDGDGGFEVENHKVINGKVR